MLKKQSFLKILLLMLIYSTALISAPVITNISPNLGPSAGGNTVTITGSGFTGTIAVNFGSRAATFTVVSDTTITAIAPVSAAGDASITVTTPTGISALSQQDLYVYQGSWYAYDADENGDANPINLTTNTVLSPILIGPVPSAIAITPDAQTALYLTSNAAGLIFIDIATNTVIGSVPFASSVPAGIAITPDGKSAYVAANNQIIQISLASHTIVDTISLPGARHIAIAPDGKLAYISFNLSQTLDILDLTTNTIIGNIIGGSGGSIGQLAITPDGTLAYATNVNLHTLLVYNLTTNTFSTSIPLATTSPQGLAITPDGQLVFVANLVSDNVSVINVASQSVIATISLSPSDPFDIAISPDGKTAYVSAQVASEVIPINVATLAPGTPIPLPSFGGPIAITPDQAPVASFTFTSPNIFDASSSRSAVGSIATYSWDFGDGQTLTTASPIITHDYAALGSYTVTLTVTNTAGTSTTQIFTGHTLSRNGGPSARSSQVVTVLPPSPQPPASPSHFKGKSRRNQFATQTEYFNHLTWNPSFDPTIVAYQLFRNGRLIASIPASGPFVYNDQNRQKNSHDVYTLIAVNAEGLQSIPVIITVKR